MGAIGGGQIWQWVLDLAGVCRRDSRETWGEKRDDDVDVGLDVWFLSKALFIKTTPENASSLLQAFSRLSATSQALTADTYLETYLTGILKATGFSKNLLDKMVENEINDLVDAVK